jgi:hypothetical protein
MNEKNTAFIIILRLLAGSYLLKEGFNIIFDRDPFLLPIVLVSIGVNLALWRPSLNGFFLVAALLGFQSLQSFYLFVTSTFLSPRIDFSQESKLLFGLMTLFFSAILMLAIRRREELGYVKTASFKRKIGVMLLMTTIVAFAGTLSIETFGLSRHEIVHFPGQNILHGVLTPNGKYLAIDQMDDKYHHATVLWDTERKTIVKTLFSRETMIRMIASPNGKYIATIGQGVKVWDVENGELIKNVNWDRKNDKVTNSGSFSIDSKDIAFGTQEGIRIVSLHSDRISDIKIPRTFGNESVAPYYVCYSPDGQMIVAARKQEISLWDSKTGQSIGIIRSGLKNMARGFLKISPDGRYLAVTGLPMLTSMAVEIIDIEQRRSLGDITIDSTQINAVEFSPDGRFVAVGSINRAVDLIIVKELKKKRLYGTHPFPAVYLLAFSPDGKTMFTGGGNTLKIWKME